LYGIGMWENSAGIAKGHVSDILEDYYLGELSQCMILLYFSALADGA